MNFALMQYHKYSLSEIENMLPWEKEVYTTFLVQYLEELKPTRQEINVARAIKSSLSISRTYGSYATFRGSPASNGILQFDIAFN